MAVNQKQIAQMLGINRATVSKALSGSPEISETLKERVKLLCQELGYEPNYHARSLLTNRTGVIAIVKQDLRLSMLLSDWVNQIQAMASRHSLKVRLENLNDIGRTMAEQSVDGFISFHTPREEPHLAKLLGRSDRPIIFTDCSTGDFEHNAVAVDNTGAGRMCVEHLADLGHRNIAFFGFVNNNGPCIDRFKGYSDGCREMGLVGSLAQVVETDWWAFDIDEVYAYEKALLDLVKAGVTGLICSSDIFAVGVMKLLRRNGYSVPHDVSVTGFDDTLTARACEPGLTSVRQPIEEAARYAVDMLVGVKESGELSQPVILQAVLVPRHSTAPVPMR